MFPMDVATTCLQAIFAWTLFLGRASSALSNFVGGHWFATSVAASAVILTTASVASIENSKKKEDLVHAPHKKTRLAFRKAGFIGRLLTNLFRHAWVAYWVVTIALFVFGLFVIVVLFLVGPFQKTGSDLAAKDERSGFSRFPEVMMTTPDGTKSNFRVIECYGNFCAIYKDHRAYAVPAAAVTWATTPEEPTTPVPGPSAAKSSSDERKSPGT